MSTPQRRKTVKKAASPTKKTAAAPRKATSSATNVTPLIHVEEQAEEAPVKDFLDFKPYVRRTFWREVQRQLQLDHVVGFHGWKIGSYHFFTDPYKKPKTH